MQRRLVQADTARWEEVEAGQKLQAQVRETALQLVCAYTGQRTRQEEMILTVQRSIASIKVHMMIIATNVPSSMV